MVLFHSNVQLSSASDVNSVMEMTVYCQCASQMRAIVLGPAGNKTIVT